MGSGITISRMFPYISKFVVFILVKDTSMGTEKLEATPKVTESQSCHAGSQRQIPAKCSCLFSFFVLKIATMDLGTRQHS